MTMLRLLASLSVPAMMPTALWTPACSRVVASVPSPCTKWRVRLAGALRARLDDHQLHLIVQMGVERLAEAADSRR
jgi:hypothetical protein